MMKASLMQVEPATRALLDRYGFDEVAFEALRERLRSGHAEEEDNRLAHPVEPPRESDMSALPRFDTAERATLTALGKSAIAQGKVAVAILAGGMATRFGGVVKAGVRVLGEHSFLDLKLRDIAQVARDAGTPLNVLPMTSFATHAEVARSCAPHASSALTVEPFAQLISLRLTRSGELFRRADGTLSPYAPGHGDLVDALRRAGLLQRLRAAGVEQLFLSNVDNLAATFDPAVIGAHLQSGVALTFEVAPLWPGDKGGVPARLDGRLQVIEALRYPAGFVESSIPWMSTNSMVISLAELERELALDWFRVTKQVDGQPAIQFERLVNQLTAFMSSRVLQVARDGLECRFLPVKDPLDLQTRLPEIQRVLQARKVL